MQEGCWLHVRTLTEVTKCTKAVFRAHARKQTEAFGLITAPARVDGLHLTQADTVDAQARSEASRLFTEPLKQVFRLGKVSNVDYRNFVRYFLSLPPATSIGNHTDIKEFAYPAQNVSQRWVSPHLDTRTLTTHPPTAHPPTQQGNGNTSF